MLENQYILCKMRAFANLMTLFHIFCSVCCHIDISTKKWMTYWLFLAKFGNKHDSSQLEESMQYCCKKLSLIGNVQIERVIIQLVREKSDMNDYICQLQNQE